MGAYSGVSDNPVNPLDLAIRLRTLKVNIVAALRAHEHDQLPFRRQYRVLGRPVFLKAYAFDVAGISPGVGEISRRKFHEAPGEAV